MFEYKYKNIHVQGVSIGGIETCYILPHFNIAFDVGRCPYPLVDIPKVFITHGHLDHASGLPYYISQRSLRRLSPPDVYMPQKLYPDMKKILNLWNKIENFNAQSNLHPLEWGDRVDIQKNYSVHAIPAYHRVPTQGYILMHRTKKLREDYLGLSSTKIVQLKKEKPDDLFEVRESPLFAFSGDTTIEFVLKNKLVQQTKVLFLECTYIDDKRDVARAREWGHTHLDEIIENFDYFKNEKLVLVHFSKRYYKNKIKRVLEKKLPQKLRDKVDIFVV